MTRNQLLKKIKFSPDDFVDIENAVKNAEKKTQGEIAVALTAESYGISFYFAGVVLLYDSSFRSDLCVAWNKILGPSAVVSFCFLCDCLYNCNNSSIYSLQYSVY